MIKDDIGPLNILEKAFVADILATEFLSFMTNTEGRVIKFDGVTYVVWKEVTEPETFLNYNKWDDSTINLTYWSGGDVLTVPDHGLKVWVSRREP